MLIFLISTVSSRECYEALPREMICWPVNSSGKVLDDMISANCTVFHSTYCDGNRSFLKNIPYRYCYQSDNTTCVKLTNCDHNLLPKITDCYSNTDCIGPSLFEKQGICSKTSKSQTTAFLLSLFLGVFGADRFYLGRYVSASFKLITIGGLGVAYTIDLFLILFGFLGPSDGSLYPERF